MRGGFRIWWVLGWVVTVAGCSNPFEPYNHLAGFRMLAVRAEPPDLAPSSTATLSALLFVPDQRPVSYDWSWCPFTAGPEQGYACAFTRDELQKAVDQRLGPGAVTIPQYALGATSTVTYAYTLPPALYQGICQASASMMLPSFVTLPDCAAAFPINIELKVKTGTQAINAVKQVNLKYDAGAPRNSNPRIASAYVASKDKSSPPMLLDPANPPVLQRNVQYQLSLTILDSQSETYIDNTLTPPGPARETLVITWFVEAGTTDKTRTVYAPGSLALDTASVNLWTTPKAVDYPKDHVRLFFVIRDGREGVGWLVREVLLEDGT
jgi:hypothetical protein